MNMDVCLYFKTYIMSPQKGHTSLVDVTLVIAYLYPCQHGQHGQ